MTIARECRNMAADLIRKDAFDGMVNRCRWQNAAGNSFLNIINDHLALNLVDTSLDNTLQIPCKLLRCFAKI